MAKIAMYESDGKSTLKTKSGSVRTQHSIDARQLAKSAPNRWVLMTETEDVNGYKKIVTAGIRKVCEKDVLNRIKEAKVLAEAAQKAIEDAEANKEAFLSANAENAEDAPKGSRKANVRVSSK